MKLLMVADGRSPITRRWISMLAPFQFEVVLISSYPCDEVDGVSKLYTLPLAFASQGGSQAGSGSQSLAKQLISRFRPLAQKIRHLLGPWMVDRRAKDFLAILEAEKPDLVHALRIPFEGMLARNTPANTPLLISTWGNDFTLHARSTSKMASLTRQTLRRADGLFSDTRRDLELAKRWGFDVVKPALVVPGNGGIEVEELLSITEGIQKNDPPQVINPRGLRSYVRSDTFFKAIPLVLDQRPEAQFVCASMESQSEALAWVRKLGIEKNIQLLGYLPQSELWQHYARSRVLVSISEHDGTPNSLLEAMTIGCLPVCGDISSIHEWIEDGENGLLVNPSDEKALAAAILRGLQDAALQNRAAQVNQAIIRERAQLVAVRDQVRDFYARFR